ncbi:MAG: CoA pyrophosphatase [Rhodospirillales bacterium]|nr:CoA pyrophosphatase [Rhodospirillales bacterium]
MSDAGLDLLGPDEVRRRLEAAAGDIGLRRAGLRVADRVRGDHDLNPGLEPMPPLTPAAVLVPLVARAEGLTVLLTQRTAHLAAHAGQISFPGGQIERDDADPAAAALREAAEEIGLPPGQVEIVGRLDTYQTRTGFEIVPLVGLVAPPFDLQLDSFEVAEAFEVPLSFILDPANHQRHSRAECGIARYFWAMPYGARFIWGATAGMLVNLYEVLRGPLRR